MNYIDKDLCLDILESTCLSFRVCLRSNNINVLKNDEKNC